jgi:hypothetical protein
MYVAAINNTIPEVTSDPATPVAGQAWVLKEGTGTPLGLLLAITTAGVTYFLSYRTYEGTTVRVQLH